LTLNHSYDQAPKLQAPKLQARPTLPRSRSAAYIHKHSRTPSIADKQLHYDQAIRSRAAAKSSLEVKTNSLIAADHLTFSPAGSISPEDDDDRGRRRKIEDLAETLRESMPEQKRRHSPTRLGGQIPNGASVAATALGTLTPEALKIVHSRSSSEMQLAVPNNQLTPSTQSSPGDSDDDDGLEMKRGPLVRKKSGELVKPALRGPVRRRPSSAPGTPTFPKAVHFNDDIEQVRHFLQVDRPIAVSAGSSPVETYDSESDYPFSENKPRPVEWEIRTQNFPSGSLERQCLPVRVERLTLSKDHKTLLGTVAVANLAFEKSVTARFTFDYWKITSEIAAEYSTLKPQKGVSDGFDRFQFAIKLSDQAHLQDKTLYLCVRYNVGGQEYWDSNGGKNYQVDFIKKTTARPVQAPLAGIPRSRHNSAARLPRPKSFPAAGNDDEFSTSYSSPYHPRQSAANTLRINAQPDSSEAAQRNASGRLSNRYDFNASLHAALTTAQNALGERSGLTRSDLTLKAPERPRAKPRVAPPVAASVPAKPTPKGNSKDRPDLNSAEYKDLLQKFCYFGSQTVSGAPTTTVSPQNKEAGPLSKTELQQTDGVADSGSESKTSSADSSASNSPPSPVAQLHQPVMMMEETKTPSRSPTPSLRGMSPRLLPYRSPSPALNSAYQEFPHQGLTVQTTKC
jgi:hypothetical protein